MFKITQIYPLKKNEFGNKYKKPQNIWQELER